MITQGTRIGMRIPIKVSTRNLLGAPYSDNAMPRKDCAKKAPMSFPLEMAMIIIGQKKAIASPPMFMRILLPYLSDNAPAKGKKMQILNKRAAEFTPKASGTGGSTNTSINVAIQTKQM